VPAAVTNALTAQSGPTAWTAPGPAFDATPAKGKTIYYLPASAEVPIIQTIYSGMQQAVAAVGAHVQLFDAKGLPSEFNRGMQMAIGQNVAAIIIEAIPPTLIKAPILQAHSKGIKIVTVDTRDESFPPAFPEIDASIALPYYHAGALAADWIISDSQGKGSVLIFESSDLPSSVDVGTAATKEFAKYAPGIKVRTIGVTLTQWSSLNTRVATELTADPSITYVLPVFDGMALTIVPGIQQAGAANRVKVSTFNASPAVMKYLKEGVVVGADVGNSNVWHGWAQIDEALRLVTGHQPAKSEKIKLRIFDKSNIGTIDITKPEETWFGPTFPQDFRSGFKRLWGV
jgi:ribose transport system substrate-binding protein